MLRMGKNVMIFVLIWIRMLNKDTDVMIASANRLDTNVEKDGY